MSDLSNNSESQRSRKRVRKGTRSCWECKRRKIKCIFASENDHICAGCLDRGTNCLSQEYADDQGASTGSRLGQRMGRVEQLLEQLMETIASNNGGVKQLQTQALTPPLNESNHSNDILTPSLTPGQYESAPIMSMFDNNVIARGQGQESVGSTPQGSYRTFPTPNSSASVPISRAQAKLIRLRETLLALLPTQHDVDVLTETSSGWYSIKRHVLVLSNIPGGTTDPSLASFSVDFPHDAHPSSIGRLLVCLTICLQQLIPQGFDKTQLDTNTPLETLAERYLSSVQTLITSDDELVCTFDGVECLILLGIFHLNSGNLRRSWLLFRRALNVSQIMGFHRAHKSVKDLDEINNIRARFLWYQVVKCDRYLALILGLPSGTGRDPFTSEPEDSHSLAFLTVEDRYTRKLCNIAGMLLERNASDELAYGATQEIDEALENLKLSMPKEWWQIPAYSEGGKSQIALEQTDRMLAHTWHSQLEALTHLPFMLRAATERRYEYSRFTCRKASRDMIERWLFMRIANAPGFVCHILDFQAFTCAVTLLLGILDPSLGGNDEKQIEDDKRMVDKVLRVLDGLRRTCPDEVATQSVEVLKTLLGVTMHPGAPGNLRLTIPYFGTIHVNNFIRENSNNTRGTSHLSAPQLQNQQPNLEQWQQMQTQTNQLSGSVMQPPVVSFSSSQFPEADVGNWTFPDEDMLIFDNLSSFDVSGNWNFPIDPYAVQTA